MGSGGVVTGSEGRGVGGSVTVGAAVVGAAVGVGLGGASVGVGVRGGGVGVLDGEGLGDGEGLADGAACCAEISAAPSRSSEANAMAANTLKTVDQRSA